MSARDLVRREVHAHPVTLWWLVLCALFLLLMVVI